MDIIKEFVVVTDFFDLKNCEDVAYEIQNIIDKNPNRTIYFPDGEYTVKRPIVTPADPRKSVSLKLSDFAVIRVADGWDCDDPYDNEWLWQHISLTEINRKEG